MEDKELTEKSLRVLSRCIRCLVLAFRKKVYENAMLIELQSKGRTLHAQQQAPIKAVHYDGQTGWRVFC